MRGLVWFIAWLFVGLWSAFVFVNYWLVDLLIGIAAHNSDIRDVPETGEFVKGLALFLQSIGSTVAITLWAVITIAILGIAWIVTRLTGSPSTVQPPAHD